MSLKPAQRAKTKGASSRYVGRLGRNTHTHTLRWCPKELFNSISLTFSQSKQMKSMAWKWNRRTHPRYNGSGGNFGRCLELFSTYIYYATYHTPTTVHLSNYMPGVFTRVQTKNSQTTPNQFECENVDLKRFPSTTHSVMFLMGKSILWLPLRTRTATQQPTMEGVRRCAIFDDLRAAQRESPVRSFVRPAGWINTSPWNPTKCR